MASAEMDGDRLRAWVDLVSARYPPGDAEEWDSVGLQVGDPDDLVRAVLVCLDVTAATLDEAARRGADLLLAHHPLLFRPLSRLTPATAAGRLALRAARERVGVLAAHTNLDAAVPGTSDPVADLLGLRDVRPLVPAPKDSAARPQRVKLVTFVPQEQTDAVLAALAGAGAGRIGEYDECSFRVAGTGTFRPSVDANPAVGERLRRNEVAEDRLEVEVAAAALAGVVAALLRAHPYEEVAYDLVPLLELPPAGRRKGLGLIGELHEPMPLEAVADRIAARLPAPHLRMAGEPAQRVQRIAVCGGAGDALVADALRAGAQLFVTGDLRHHPALDARTMGLALIDAGHHATEVAALPGWRAILAEEARRRGLRARLLASEISTDPWTPLDPTAERGGRDGRPMTQGEQR